MVWIWKAHPSEPRLIFLNLVEPRQGSVCDPIGVIDLTVYLGGPKGLRALVKNVWSVAGMRGRIHSERFDFRGAYGISDLLYVGNPVLNAAQQWIAERKGLNHAVAGS